MDWFQRLTGFAERDYAQTRERLRVDGEHLHVVDSDRRWRIGRLELASLAALRDAAADAGIEGRRALRVRCVSGDVRALHAQAEHAGALFQVASQFNLLEMVSPAVTPEHGVGRYESDLTQGPACAIAAGAATIYRNYFAPVDGVPGQTADRQIDALRDLGCALAAAVDQPVHRLWEMRNGYALASREGLEAIAAYLRRIDESARDALRGTLQVGLHWDVEVTTARSAPPPLVSQASCSALPVAYSNLAPRHWQPFAELVLEAAYEATLLAGILNARRGASDIVLLTALGGGAFGNDEAWIERAIRRALQRVAHSGLDVRLVSYGEPPPMMRRLAHEWN